MTFRAPLCITQQKIISEVDIKGEPSLTLRCVLKISVHLPALKGKTKMFILEQVTKAQRGSIALLFL